MSGDEGVRACVSQTAKKMSDESYASPPLLIHPIPTREEHNHMAKMKMASMDWFQNMISVDGTLGKQAQSARKIILVSSTIALVGNTAFWFSIFETANDMPSFHVSSALFTVLYSAFIYLVLFKKQMSAPLVVPMIYGLSFGAYVYDLGGRNIGNPGWPLLVIAIDLMLVLQMPTKYTFGLVAFTVVYLVIVAVEESFRFGLLDLPGFGTQEVRRKYYEDMLACDTLPCPVSFPPNNLVATLMVFLMDFVITRGFATTVMKEQAAMQRTISAVQEITALLAKYDVDGVARMLDARKALLPPEMHATLEKMELNLRRYRPYLPAALFDRDDQMSVQSVVSAPGAHSEAVTVVFTDIRSSTSIWEGAPDGMRDGLWIHNSVMRTAMQTFSGYEVKTIGDAFMVAFETTQEGVDFGLNVHEMLRAADWPASLMEVPICAERGDLWGGLTVRIGVNSGPVAAERNALTGRTDYFGHTVNVAARIESTCTPGAVAVPADLWEQHCGGCVGVAGTAEALELKGVAEPVLVCCVWPPSLAERRFDPLQPETMPLLPFMKSTMRNMTDGEVAHSMSETLARTRVSAVATVGVLEVEVVVRADECGGALQDMSNVMSVLMTALDQSGGTLVSLLGSRVCVGWNLVRATQAHAENAVHFMERVHSRTALAGAGLASGPTEHGDVGSRTQRFLTVMGPSVQRSWALCEEAVSLAKVFLYAPPMGTSLPASLAEIMKPSTTVGVYEYGSSRHDNVFEVTRTSTPSRPRRCFASESTCS